VTANFCASPWANYVGAVNERKDNSDTMLMKRDRRQRAVQHPARS
jgi:hypothetical protein